MLTDRDFIIFLCTCGVLPLNASPGARLVLFILIVAQAVFGERDPPLPPLNPEAARLMSGICQLFLHESESVRRPYNSTHKAFFEALAGKFGAGCRRPLCGREDERCHDQGDPPSRRVGVAVRLQFSDIMGIIKNAIPAPAGAGAGQQIMFDGSSIRGLPDRRVRHEPRPDPNTFTLSWREDKPVALDLRRLQDRRQP